MVPFVPLVPRLLLPPLPLPVPLYPLPLPLPPPLPESPAEVLGVTVGVEVDGAVMVETVSGVIVLLNYPFLE